MRTSNMDDQDRTLYCGNLASDITEEILYELFLQAGPLARVTIPKDRDGKKRSYGFITFKHDVSVNYAIDLLNGIKLYGRPLRLQTRSGGNVDGNGDVKVMYQKSFYGNSDSRGLNGGNSLDCELVRSSSNSCNNAGANGNQCVVEPPAKRHTRERSRDGASEYEEMRNGLINEAPYRSAGQVWQGGPGFYPMQNVQEMGINAGWPNNVQSQIIAFSHQNNFVNDKSSIFDPVIEQKMRERLLLIQQQDQMKMLQHNLHNQGGIGQFQASVFHRGHQQGSWWH